MTGRDEQDDGLAEVRRAIDALDAEIVQRLVDRERWVRRAAAFKTDESAVRAPDRVEQVVGRVRALAAAAGGSPDVVERIYRALIGSFVEAELTEHRGSAGALPRRVVELVGVPFDGYGRPGHQAAAAAALLEAGLAEALGDGEVVQASPMDLPPGDGTRGARTSLINEDALEAMAAAVGRGVTEAVAAARFPVVHGADCSTLLGTIPALAAHAPLGLLFLDGHEDTMPLDVSEDGEAANSELGLLLGRTGRTLPAEWQARLPALERDALAVLGPRDEAWRRQFGVASLREDGVWLRDWREVGAAPEREAVDAVRHLRAATPRWWLHVDLDVLDPEEFPAQGLPDVDDDPDGLTWDQLTRAAVAAVGAGGCVGCSIAIYDPEQDPDRTAARQVVSFVAAVVAALDA